MKSRRFRKPRLLTASTGKKYSSAAFTAFRQIARRMMYRAAKSDEGGKMSKSDLPRRFPRVGPSCAPEGGLSKPETFARSTTAYYVYCIPVESVLLPQSTAT